MFLDSAARRLRRFFARKHCKYRCENKTQVQFRVSKVPKLELTLMLSFSLLLCIIGGRRGGARDFQLTRGIAANALANPKLQV